ncbi:hypothetical protein 2203_scaffold802_00063 [Bacteriophage sp.]|nr:hypothetical protein 2203_scaffold802_00063 [Bacteriophage sp.]
MMLSSCSQSMTRGGGFPPVSSGLSLWSIKARAALKAAS